MLPMKNRRYEAELGETYVWIGASKLEGDHFNHYTVSNDSLSVTGFDYVQLQWTSLTGDTPDPPFSYSKDEIFRTFIRIPSKEDLAVKRSMAILGQLSHALNKDHSSIYNLLIETGI